MRLKRGGTVAFFMIGKGGVPSEASSALCPGSAACQPSIAASMLACPTSSTISAIPTLFFALRAQAADMTMDS